MDLENTLDEEEIICTNHSNFTKDGYVNLNKEIAKKSYMIIIVLMIALLIIDVVLYLYKSWIFAGVLSSLIIVYPFAIKLSLNRQLNRTYETYKKSFEDAKYDYIFKKDRIDLVFNCKGMTNNGSIKYTSIYSAIITNNYLFILIASNQGYIVEQEGFSRKEEFEKVVELLKKNEIKIKDSRKK